MLPIMDHPPKVCLIKRWWGSTASWWPENRWVDLMPRDKAALIVEAFDFEDTGRFLILGDWMEDHGDVETQRFREGNWHDQDYDHASITLFWQQIQEFRSCPSVKVFIRLLQANWKHDKFLKWYSPCFQLGQSHIYNIMLDPKKFDECYGEERRRRLCRYPSVKFTEEKFRELCEEAKTICYWLRKKADLAAWAELWRDRCFYIERKKSNWEKSYNPANSISW